MERKLVQGISITPKDVSTFFQSIPKDSIPFINMKLSFQQIVYYPKITKDDKKRAYDILVNDIDFDPTDIIFGLVLPSSYNASKLSFK